MLEAWAMVGQKHLFEMAHLMESVDEAASLELAFRLVLLDVEEA